MQSSTAQAQPSAPRRQALQVPRLPPNRIWPTLAPEVREAALREVSQMILALVRPEDGQAPTAPAAPEAAHDPAR